MTMPRDRDHRTAARAGARTLRRSRHNRYIGTGHGIVLRGLRRRRRLMLRADCPGGRRHFGSALYAATDRDNLPVSAVAASLGCGNPIAVAELREGEKVLDLGSGGGIDVLLVGSSSRRDRVRLRCRHDRRDARPGPG